MRILVLLTLFILVTCNTKSFIVPVLNDIEDYKQIYKFSDTDIRDTIKINNGYKITYR